MCSKYVTCSLHSCSGGWDDVNLGNDFTKSQAEVKRGQSRASVQQDPPAVQNATFNANKINKYTKSCLFDSPCRQTCSSKMKNKCKVRVVPQGYACGFSCTTKLFSLLNHVLTWSNPLYISLDNSTENACSAKGASYKTMLYTVHHI